MLTIQPLPANHPLGEHARRDTIDRGARELLTAIGVGRFFCNVSKETKKN